MIRGLSMGESTIELQNLIEDYEKYPNSLSFDFEESEREFVVMDNPRPNSQNDVFVHSDSELFQEDELAHPAFTQSLSDISLNCDDLILRKDLQEIEESFSEELDVRFNVEDEFLTRMSNNKSPADKSKFKYQNFEAITARLDYEDLEILRALKTKIKQTRKDYVKPNGVKRERITENMILRALVKTFVRHSLESQSFKWGLVNSEEDLLKQISRSFKGIN